MKVCKVIGIAAATAVAVVITPAVAETAAIMTAGYCGYKIADAVIDSVVDDKSKTNGKDILMASAGIIWEQAETYGKDGVKVVEKCIKRYQIKGD